MKKFPKKLILILVLALGLVLPVFLLNLDSLKPHISKFILDQIKSKVNAELIFTNPHYEFQRFKLFLSADQISFKQDGDLVLDLKKFNLIYPLRNIFRSRQIISAISAEKFFIKAVREKEGWNLERILKPSDKKVDFIFKSLKLHDTDLEIYSDDFFEKENVYLDIHKDKITKLYNVEFYNNQGIKDLALEQTISAKENQFYIAGEYDLNNHEGVYKFVKNLKVVLAKMKPNLINLISRAFTDRKSRFLYLFNRYAVADTELNLVTKELENVEERYKVDLDLSHLSIREDFKLSSEFDLDKNVKLNSLDIDFLQAQLSANGMVTGAFLDEPKLDLDIKLTKFNPYLFRNKIPEIREIISDRVVTFTSTIHKSPVFDIDAKVTGAFFHPELNISLPVTNFYTTRNATKKNFNLDLILGEDSYKLKNLLIPFEFAELVVNGDIAKSGAFDLKVFAQDFPLRSLKPMAMSFMDDKKVKAIKDLVVRGYLKSDLNIKKKANQEIPELYGSIVLAETSILEPHMPLLMQNINADLKAEKNLITVSSFEGSLYENKVDLNGFYNISTNEHKTNVSSKDFDLAKIETYQIKKYIPKIDNFKNIAGHIENLELNSEAQMSSFASSGKIAAASFNYISNGEIINVNKLESGFAFHDGLLELDELTAYINSNSSLQFDGKVDFKQERTSFKTSAKKLPFELLSIINLGEMPFEAKGGLISFDAVYKDQKLDAKGDLDDLSFGLDSKKMPENFRAVNGDFAIDDHLFINGLTAFYGNSKIKAKKFLIKEVFSEDKYYDLDMNIDMKISEFESFIPKTVAQLLHLEGYMPLHFRALGDTQKFYLDIDGDLKKVDKLVFADWLDFDTKKVKADFRSSFSFTPKLILSKDTVLNLSNESSKATIAADFEIHDWKEKKELRYSIDAYTPIDVNGNFIPVDLDLIEPHIVSVETLNLDPGTGTVQCRTDGSLDDRHTFCDIEFLDRAVAENFGIGDLVSSKSSAYLISIKDRPVYIKVALYEGLWKVLDFIRVKFDMEVTADRMNIDRLRAKLKEGFIRSNIAFDFNTLASKFKIKANNVSAHKAAESFFALGHEVPQGTVSGQFEGKTKGLLPDDMFFNLEAKSSALVRDGKLSSLKTMQKLLSAVNTLKNFDFNNVFQTLITYKGGIFNDIVTYLHFDKGKITTEKLLLHSDQIELHLEGFVDYAQDYLSIRGLGAVPERSKSFLQVLGVKQFNLGNLLSIVNLRNPGSKDKDYFAFSMKGPANNLDEATQSLRQNFTWLRSYGASE